MYYSSFTRQLIPLLPSPTSLILTLTGNHGTQNGSVFFHKTNLSFFISPRFSIQLWVRVWSTEGRVGLSREPTSREIRYSFTRESDAHVLSRPLTYQLLYKSITRAQCPPLGPGTHSPLSIGSRGGGSPQFWIPWCNLNATLFRIILRKWCVSAMKMFLTHKEIHLHSPGCGGTLNVSPIHNMDSSDIPVIHGDK